MRVGRKSVSGSENAYMAVVRAKIKVALDGSLVYYFDVWVEDQAGQEVILGMDFMVR